MAKRLTTGMHNPAYSNFPNSAPMPLNQAKPFQHAAPYLPPSYPQIPQGTVYQFMVPGQMNQRPMMISTGVGPTAVANNVATATMPAATTAAATVPATTAAAAGGPAVPAKPWEKKVVMKKTKKLKAANSQTDVMESKSKHFLTRITFLLCFLAFSSIAFSACDLALTNEVYFTNSSSAKMPTWVDCPAGASSVAPNTLGMAGFFWFCVSTGVWIGLLVFLFGMYVNFAMAFDRTSDLKCMLLIVMFLLLPLQIIFEFISLAGSVACLGAKSSESAGRIKIAMPVLAAISGIAEMVICFFVARQLRAWNIMRMAGYGSDMPSGSDEVPVPEVEYATAYSPFTVPINIPVNRPISNQFMMGPSFGTRTQVYGIPAVTVQAVPQNGSG